jgi:hypothetical protein
VPKTAGKRQKRPTELSKLIKAYGVMIRRRHELLKKRCRILQQQLERYYRSADPAMRGFERDLKVVERQLELLDVEGQKHLNRLGTMLGWTPGEYRPPLIP